MQMESRTTPSFYFLKYIFNQFKLVASFFISKSDSDISNPSLEKSIQCLGPPFTAYIVLHGFLRPISKTSPPLFPLNEEK